MNGIGVNAIIIISHIAFGETIISFSKPGVNNFPRFAREASDEMPKEVVNCIHNHKVPHLLLLPLVNCIHKVLHLLLKPQNYLLI